MKRYEDMLLRMGQGWHTLTDRVNHLTTDLSRQIALHASHEVSKVSHLFTLFRY